MTGDYDNTNRGVLFQNNRRTADKHPTMTGKINVDGVEYWLSGWTKYKGNSGEKFLSLAITPKEEKGGRGTRRGDDNPGPAFPSDASGMDEVPFALFLAPLLYYLVTSGLAL